MKITIIDRNEESTPVAAPITRAAKQDLKQAAYESKPERAASEGRA